MAKSNVKNNEIQKKIDTFWHVTLLDYLPKWITPNKISIFRLALIPLIIILLTQKLIILSVVLFLIATLSDMLDGALARHRGQITEWGLILDPMADKLLIIMLTIFLLMVYPYKLLIFLMMMFELIILIVATVKISQPNKKRSKIIASNIWGKSKMLTQVLGLIMIFLWLANPVSWLLLLSGIIISISLILQIASAISYSSPKK